MLRKSLQLLLAALLCAVIVAGIYCARQWLAVERLTGKRQILGNWHYHFASGKIGGLNYGHPQDGLRGRWQRMIASPRFVTLSPGTVLDAALARDLGVLGVEELRCNSCRGFTREAVAQLSKVPSLRSITLQNCDLTDDALDALWPALPNLESADLQSMALEDDGFLSVKAAQKLKHLSLVHLATTTRGLRMIHELPNLAEIDLVELPGMTGPNASILATMPHLRTVNLTRDLVGLTIAGGLASLKPSLVVKMW